MVLTCITVLDEAPTPAATPTRSAASPISSQVINLNTRSRDSSDSGLSSLPPAATSVNPDIVSPSPTAQGAVPSLTSTPSSPAPPIFASSRTAPATNWQTDHWKKGVEKARKRLPEADISKLDSLLGDRDSLTEAVDELKAQISSHCVHGNQSDTARRFEKFLRILDKYGQVVDVYIQHSPEVTALVWGSVRLMIDVWLTWRILRNS